MREVNCGDANPKGNVALSFKGGCGKLVSFEDGYRCTGCGGVFHKECIFKHFKLEKNHDWGRAEERKEMSEKLKFLADKLVTTLGSMEPDAADRVVADVARSIYVDILGMNGDIKRTVSILACGTGGLTDLSEYEFMKGTNSK